MMYAVHCFSSLPCIHLSLIKLVDRHVVLTANREDRGPMGGAARRRGMGRAGHGMGGFMGSGPMGMMGAFSDWR